MYVNAGASGMTNIQPSFDEIMFCFAKAMYKYTVKYIIICMP